MVVICIFSTEVIAEENSSFAQEYSYLSKLLESVTDRESAISYKPEISPAEF